MTAMEQGVITLLKSAITGKSYPLPEDFDMEAASQLLKQHSVEALGYLGAAQCGVSPALPVMQKLMEAYGRSIWISERQMLLVNQLFGAFDAAGIEYMPVKGCNLKAFYPEPGLRSMGDADILIRMEQYNRIKPIMEKLGFVEGMESDHELVWTQKPLMVELHKRLIPSYNQDYYSYYGNGWKLADHAEGTHYYMTDEDQFIYILTHFAKHYRDGGIGCRHVLDLWLCLRCCPDMDMQYIEAELEKLTILDFYRNLRTLIGVWFEDGQPDARTDFMTRFIMASGDWGQFENHMISMVARQASAANQMKGSRLRWLFEVAFPNRELMQTQYPFLGKYPVMLPFAWVHRWFRVLFFSRKKAMSRLNGIRKVSDTEVLEYEKALDYVGLSFPFQEP